MNRLEVILTAERTTKRTVRYSEVSSNAGEVFRTVYIQKDALEKLGPAEKVKITVEVEGSEEV